MNFVYPGIGRLFELSFFQRVKIIEKRILVDIVSLIVTESCANGLYLNCTGDSISISFSYFINTIDFNADYSRIQTVTCYEDDFVLGKMKSSIVSQMNDTDFISTTKNIFCNELNTNSLGIMSQCDYKFKVIDEGSAASQICQ